MGFVQQMFDWYAPPKVPATPDLEQKVPLVRITRSFDAIKTEANDTPTPLNHPRANRRLRLNQVELGYELRRSARRSIGLVVRPEGLSVSAPRWATQAQVDQVLQDKAAWVLRKLGQAQQQRRAAAPIEWRHGATLPYLGAPLRLELDPAHRFSAVGAQLCPAQAPDTPAVLHLALAQQAQPGQIRDVVQAWLARQAQALFTQRLDHYAAVLGVRWQRLTLTHAATRWGSAKSDGSIRLNLQLIHLRLALIDYVVVHELSHLRQMNHSPQFWDTVASALPDYAGCRAELREAVLAPKSTAGSA